MSIFASRMALKPFDYPDVVFFKDKMQESASSWTFHHWNFLSDIQDYKVNLDDAGRSAIKRSLLAISQIEVAVKEFWLKIGDRFPRPEFKQVGVCFAESEIRHQDAYSHLLEVLHLNDEFEKALHTPEIYGRVLYLNKYIKNSPALDNQSFTKVLFLFTTLVEYVSLFSQFFVIKSFNKHLNFLKDIENVVQATAKEEQLHAMFGFWLVKEIKKESPSWFGEDFDQIIGEAIKKAYQAESRIIDWIFAEGELSFISSNSVKNYVAYRLNKALDEIGNKTIARLQVNDDLLKESTWFEEEILLPSHTDFFAKRPVAYSRPTEQISAKDLF